MARDVKAWTVYPATQEDRDIIERKASEAGLSVSSYLCMVGKLARIGVEITPAPAEPKPVEPKPAEPKPYVLCDLDGNILPQDVQDYLRREKLSGNAERVFLPRDEDPEQKRRIYRSQLNDMLYEVIFTKKGGN